MAGQAIDKGETAVASAAGPGLAKAVKAPLGLVLLLGALTGGGPLSIDMYLPGLPAIGADFHARPGAAQ